MKFTAIISVLILMLALSSCESNSHHSNKSDVLMKDRIDSVAYALGMGMTTQFSFFNREDYRPIPMETAINDFLADEEFRLTTEERDILIRAYFTEKVAFKEDSMLRRSKAWLEENKTKEGVFETPRGLQYKYLKKSGGVGISPDGNDVAHIKYTQGSVYRGELWNQSMATNPVSKDTVKIVLNMNLSGLSEGLQLMTVGDKMRFWLPPEIGSAEGKDPAGVSEKNEIIYMDVELLRVIDRKTSNLSEGERNQAPGYFINEDERND